MRILLVAAVALIAMSCGLSDSDIATSTATTTTFEPLVTSPMATTSTVASTTTLPSPWPNLPDDGRVRALRTLTGVTLPVIEERPDGFLVQTPCQNEVVVEDGQPLTGAHVVIDPGHGGADEPGAVGPNGLTEAELNLAVSVELRDALEAMGLTAVLTREADFRLPIISRAQIPTVLEADLFISIHHNAGIDAPSPRPGSEVYYQVADADSRRLAGLVWEDLVTALQPFDVGWVSMSDAGAIYRENREGLDYYGVLRRPEGVPSVLAELAYLSNPAEAELLTTAAYRQAAAGAIATSVERFFTTDDAGSGFNDPIFRGYGPSGAGRLDGCIDPPL